MKKLIITSAIAILGISAMAQDRKVAVFDPTGSIEANLKEIVREEISSIVVKTSGYSLIVRQQMYRVLEESNFPTNSVVDDLRISEMAKRMDANLAFLSHITQMGNNYYISCKLMDVATAQILKQETIQTLFGLDDLMDVVNKLATGMLGNSGAEIKTNTNTNTVSDISPKTLTWIKGSAIVLDDYKGKTVLYKKEFRKDFSQGTNAIRILPQNEVRRIMEGTDALQVYNKSIRKGKNAWWWYGIGLGTSIASCFYVKDQPEIAVGYLAASLASYTVCLSMAHKSTKLVGQSVDMYNNSLNRKTSGMELKFGITGNGAGLALRF